MCGTELRSSQKRPYGAEGDIKCYFFSTPEFWQTVVEYNRTVIDVFSCLSSQLRRLSGMQATTVSKTLRG